MIITPGVLEGIFRGFNTTFNKAFEGAESQWGDVAMTVPSNSSELTYAWLGQSPRLREWLGDRIVKSVSAYGYTIQNRKFESTVEVPRTAIEDDTYSVFNPLVADIGRAAKEITDELIFSLLGAGDATLCYDGQYFFDPEHPSYASDGTPLSVSNIQAPAGNDVAGPAWYLLDTSRPIRPFIYQDRIKPQFQALVKEDDPNVFWRDVYTYGVRSRGNVGFGLWQLAQMSTAPLTGSYYGLLRATMATVRGDEGRLLGVKGTTLVVPPALEEQGRALINSALIDATTNPWAGSAKLIISPWLAA
jgi:phage major head subunit gpT-like protein